MSTELELIRRDLQSHSETITAIVNEQREMRKVLQELKTDREVRLERDKSVNGRFDDLNRKIDEMRSESQKALNEIKSIGKWVLIAFGSVLVAAIANFIIRGGLLGPLS